MARTRVLAPPAVDPAGCCTPVGRLRPKALREFAALFKALADETRLEILGLLAARTDPLCACEIESHFDLAQPTVSHHLRILREAGLVSSEKRGVWAYYTAERGALARIQQFAAMFER